MKTKLVIEALMQADPSGEMECCVNNKDILFIRRQPAHYSGPLETLVRNENKHYNITGAKMTIFGEKVQIAAVSIKDLMLMNDHLQVEADAEHLVEEVKSWKDYYAGK